MKKAESLALARAFRDLLLQEGFPVRKVLLFGSMAKGGANDDSDIDIAVVCMPFKPNRMDEGIALWRARRKIDIRIEPHCLHPEDFAEPLSFAREIERTGVEV